MTTEGRNPAPFSDEVIAVFRGLLPMIVPRAVIIHDPFAGEGIKLGRLCDQLGYQFTGVDMEAWKDHDYRVTVGNSMDADSYPPLDSFAICTSPTYNNGVNDHWQPHEGSKRLTYRIRAGHDLDSDNTARWSGRGSERAEREYWRITEACMKHWGDTALVNVKDSERKGETYPLCDMYAVMLGEHNYRVTRHPVSTPGWRVGTNRDARAEHEEVIVARRWRASL